MIQTDDGFDYFCRAMHSRDPRDIRIGEYTYTLPGERIASHPVSERDGSRMVVDDGKSLTGSTFRELPSLLPGGSLLVMNDTKVFHARLLFRKESGARIEVFCLEPVGTDFQQAFASRKSVEWEVLVGNARRWKEDELVANITVDGTEVTIAAKRTGKGTPGSRVMFSWKDENVSFGQIVDTFGAIPIPPYLNRESEELDYSRYQTSYARQQGSVAAPTAGLHFTPGLLEQVRLAGHDTAFLTLHVGAGTFKPVVNDSIGDHEMHPEHFEVSIDLLRRLRDKQVDQPCIAVGTTSVRTLESLYWAGVDFKGEKIVEVDQWRPYREESGMDMADALDVLVTSLEKEGRTALEGITRLMINPGYRFRVIAGMITNFHQPASTLLLLVSAFTGPRWRAIYTYAMDNGFRFLSYGDSCLLLPR